MVEVKSSGIIIIVIHVFIIIIIIIIVVVIFIIFNSVNIAIVVIMIIIVIIHAVVVNHIEYVWLAGDCTVHEFECPGRQCIPKTLRCNFFTDCLLGPDDELNCGMPQNTGMLKNPMSIICPESWGSFCYIPEVRSYVTYQP